MKEAVIERPVSPTVRLTTWVLISGLVAIFVGGYWLKIEIVARGQGKVQQGSARSATDQREDHTHPGHRGAAGEGW